ncbi:dihydrodipicolinate synthase family protein, partial [Amycolatopsis mediterranei]
GRLGLCRPDVRPPSRLLTGTEREQLAGLLSSWGLL